MLSITRIRQKFARASAGGALIISVALTPLITTSTVSHASSCSGGYACLWENSNYSAGKVAIGIKSSNFKTISWDNKSGNVNDKVSSVNNRGSRCDMTLWVDTGHRGDAIRFNRPSKNGISRDPHLKNGGGYNHRGSNSHKKNWDNRASSLNWTNCQKK